MIMLVILFFVLLILGLPIFSTVLMTATAGVTLFSSTSLQVISQQMFTGLDSTTLLAVPFFIVAGSIASKGKTSESLVDCMNVIFGRLPGGPVIASIATCAFFAAISGSSMATVVAVGSLMIPALKELGYPEEMNVGAMNLFLTIMVQLGLKVVAEGIETQEQLQEMLRLKIDYVQGYFFSKPLSERDILDALDKQF